MVLPFVDERKEFVVGFRAQTEWKWLIAAAFFMGEIGAGMYVVSALNNYMSGALVGLLVVLVGKTAAHLLYLGRPERFWRIFAKPSTSWISRGLYAMVIFAIFGALYIAPSFDAFSWVPIDQASSGGQAILGISLLAAVVVMIYDGFVMSYSPALPFWNTTLLPVLFLSYSLLGGATLTLVMMYGSSFSNTIIQIVERLELWLIIINFLVIAVYLYTQYYSNVTARKSVMMLLKEEYSVPFIVGVVIIGLVITLIMALSFTQARLGFILVGLAISELIGDFLLRFLMLRVGIYPPVVF
jgi:formate-dependent nitrite reductase membrane component NrfD